MLCARSPERHVGLGHRPATEIDSIEWHQELLDDALVHQQHPLSVRLLYRRERWKHAGERRHQRAIGLAGLAEPELATVGEQEAISAEPSVQRKGVHLELDSVLPLDL